MRISFTALIATFAVVGLSACGGSPSLGTPVAGSTSGLIQPSHKIKPDITSTSVTIQNDTGSPLPLSTAPTDECLTGSPPSSVPANSSSTAFPVSYVTGCTNPPPFYFDMTYNGTGIPAAACTFKINYDATSGTFTYSVSGGSATNCSATSSSGSVTFVYAVN
jgi:hypothetical protein